MHKGQENAAKNVKINTGQAWQWADRDICGISTPLHLSVHI